MDTLTHTVLGACMGQAIAGKQMQKKAMLAGALVNNFPDVDVVAQAFTTPAQALLVHRGIMHSVLMLTVLSFVLTWLFKTVLFKKQQLSYKRWFLLVSSGLFLHIGLDACTSYGTGWFEPFSHARVSFNVLFILDPFFLMPLLICAIALLILKSSSAKRQAWANAGLIISGCYLAITIAIKIYVLQIVHNSLEKQHLDYSQYMVTPAPLNNLLWYSVAQNDKDCYIGYYSVFDKSSDVEYVLFPKHDSLLATYKNSPEVQKLLQFSKGYYQVNREDSNLVFSDVRYGQAGGWFDEKAPFVFNFNIAGPNNAASLQQGRMKAMAPNAISELVKRVKGR